MIKAKMLNEMNPKLRALLAAGLIGTAGLGAASCSTSVDDPYDAPQVEQPTTPETSETEDSKETEDTTDKENTVTFESLGVKDYYAKELAEAEKSFSDKKNNIVKVYDWIPIMEEGNDYIYRNGHFKKASDMDIGKDNSVDANDLGNETYICYEYFYPCPKNPDEFCTNCYYVPKDMEFDFDTAIAAYKVAHVE